MISQVTNFISFQPSISNAQNILSKYLPTLPLRKLDTKTHDVQAH